jgi:opacity protein-like surface antigen
MGRFTTSDSLAISPIGLRMMWRYNKPYFITKGGVIAFNKKAISQDASYQNFLLQIGIGVQAKLTRRLDLRVGGGYLHFSNAFMVPSNPGIDEMAYNGGLSYHFGKWQPFLIFQTRAASS